MITDGPFSLTDNDPLTVQDPGANLGYSSAAFQVQNASPFVLEIFCNGQTYTIQEFTAQTIPTALQATPIVITPTNGPGGTTQGNVEIVWLLATETAPMTDGQLTGAAQYAVGLGELIASASTQAGGEGGVFQIPPTTRTLIVAVQGLPVSGVLSVQGTTSQQLYYDQPFYLGTTGVDYFVAYMRYSALLDPAAAIQLGSTAGIDFEIYGDTASYEESDFYNGPIQYNALASPGTLGTGPFRLLTAAISGAGSSAIKVGGQNILTTTTGDHLALPQPFIVPAGVEVTSAGVGGGEISYAYP